MKNMINMIKSKYNNTGHCVNFRLGSTSPEIDDMPLPV